MSSSRCASVPQQHARSACPSTAASLPIYASSSVSAWLEAAVIGFLVCAQGALFDASPRRCVSFRRFTSRRLNTDDFRTLIDSLTMTPTVPHDVLYMTPSATAVGTCHAGLCLAATRGCEATAASNPQIYGPSVWSCDAESAG